jgi:hypothetical protein
VDLDASQQPVAHAVNRLDVAFGASLAHSLANPGHLNRKIAQLDVEIVLAPNVVEQLVMRDNSAGILDEAQKRIELLGCQLDALAVLLEESLDGVHLAIPELIDLGFRIGSHAITFLAQMAKPLFIFDVVVIISSFQRSVLRRQILVLDQASFQNGRSSFGLTGLPFVSGHVSATALRISSGCLASRMLNVSPG